MGIALIFGGLILLIASVRNSQADLFKLVKDDVTGPNNFLEWMLALFLVGAIGFIPKLKPLSIALLTLVLLAIFLKKGQGFFSQLSGAVQTA